MLTGEGWLLTSRLIVPITLVSLGVALLFMRTHYEFRRREGVVLASIYAVFLVLIALQHQGYILAT